MFEGSRTTTADTNQRRNPSAGIALGPILFIIAILAILAAAIAAGSGGFNASVNNEGNRSKAAAIVRIGENLKMGMDRMTMENGVNYNGWTTNPSNTANVSDLFSPTGGGITAPSTSQAGGSSDVWYYPQVGIPNIGTYSSNASNTVQLAVLNVSAGVCQEINNRASNVNVAPTATAMGNFAVPANAAQGTLASLTNGAWPTVGTAGINLQGKSIGCVNNSNTGSNGYYFYQVIYTQ